MNNSSSSSIGPVVVGSSLTSHSGPRDFAMNTPLLIAALALLAGCVLAKPLQDDPDFDATPLGELSDGSRLYLLREKRQNFGRYPQNYQGGRPGGRPGGFQGGRPGGGFQGGRPGGFQQPSFAGSAANAQAQGFQSGNFGANHAGTQTQGFAAGPGGITGSAGQSFSQNYQFPGGISASVSGSGTFGAGPGGVTQGGGHSVAITGPNGQPIRG
ncbi:hypothetical protein B566_EDAN009167 [Ephemera danica]|nr:hypothetical protein B566_EDAN009167 [Ephemera danica]